jgi:hypothetical protein
MPLEADFSRQSMIFDHAASDPELAAEATIDRVTTHHFR